MRSSSLTVPSRCVHAWGIDDVADLAADHRPPLGDCDGRARVIGDGDVAAGQPAEDDALADVRLADERDAQRVGESLRTEGPAAACSRTT
jgi:hypothetical protein